MGLLERFGLGSFAEAARTRGDIVYFPGCTTQKYMPEVVENYKTVLTDLGVRVRTIEPFCCGRPLKEQGYLEEFERHKAKVKASLAKSNVKTIVTNCASCMVTLKEEFGVEVLHTTDVIAQNKRKLPSFNHGEVTIQDSCVGARSLNMTQQTRDILVHTGYTVKEFSECKKGVRCCGGSCGLPNNAGSVATKLAQRRLRDAPAQIIVTDDPRCYLQLKRSTQSKEVLELSETLVEI